MSQELQAQLDSINQEIANIKKMMQPLLDKQLDIRQQIKIVESKKKIKELGLTLDQVQLSSGDGVPYKSHMMAFQEWCKSNSSKKYIEWNYCIFPINFTSWEEQVCSLYDLESLKPVDT